MFNNILWLFFIDFSPGFARIFVAFDLTILVSISRLILLVSGKWCQIHFQSTLRTTLFTFSASPLCFSSGLNRLTARPLLIFSNCNTLQSMHLFFQSLFLHGSMALCANVFLPHSINRFLFSSRSLPTGIYSASVCFTDPGKIVLSCDCALTPSSALWYLWLKWILSATHIAK